MGNDKLCSKEFNTRYSAPLKYTISNVRFQCFCKKKLLDKEDHNLGINYVAEKKDTCAFKRGKWG